MDRQEAIEKLSTIGHISVSYAEDLYDSFFPKPAIPQFVADWYEVEKEPRYTVRIKGIGGYSKYLNRDTNTQRWLFASKTELERFRAHHTRKELEDAGFGWVFSCEGVEVKEVTDE